MEAGVQFRYGFDRYREPYDRHVETRGSSFHPRLHASGVSAFHHGVVDDGDSQFFTTVANVCLVREAGYPGRPVIGFEPDIAVFYHVVPDV